MAYRLHYGRHPGELLVLHTCDNPPCCNPAHLWLGTIADNNADMIAKGRERYVLKDEHWSRRMSELVPRGEDHYSRRLGGYPSRRGEKHHAVKLTDQQVREIRDRYAAGDITQKALAKEYGISHGHANALILRRFRKADTPAT